MKCFGCDRVWVDAAVDEAAVGQMIADDDGEEKEGRAGAERPRRLIVVSAGDVIAEPVCQQAIAG